LRSANFHSVVSGNHTCTYFDGLISTSQFWGNQRGHLDITVEIAGGGVLGRSAGSKPN